MGNRVITFIKDDDSNVINVQQFLLRDEFEHYKRELREKKIREEEKTMAGNCNDYCNDHTNILNNP